ncbi:MAG: hypothetical protein QG614_434 [Patescibacteria group bacterium]|nr:hypothetical protein [Patescibacteria group bacterium]
MEKDQNQDINTQKIESKQEGLISKTVYNIKNVDWSTRRKYAYFSGFFLIFLIIISYFLYPIIFPKPTCFDKKQNGSESGIDCGGSCSLMCKNSYQELDVLLARSFEKSNGLSDIVVLLENKNRYMAPKEINLDVDIYKTSGEFLETIKVNQLAGTQKYIPILINNYKTSDIGKVFVKNLSYSMYRTRGAYDVSLSDFEFSKDKTSIDVYLKNIYKEDIKDDLKVYILVRDNLNNISAINYQNLNGISYGETKRLNFLWSKPLDFEFKNLDIILVSNLYD